MGVREKLYSALNKICRVILPRNAHLQRVFNPRNDVTNLPGLTSRIRFVLKNMTVREIAYAYKRQCYNKKVLPFVVAELRRRGVAYFPIVSDLMAEYNDICQKKNAKCKLLQ